MFSRRMAHSRLLFYFLDCDQMLDFGDHTPDLGRVVVYDLLIQALDSQSLNRRLLTFGASDGTAPLCDD